MRICPEVQLTEHAEAVVELVTSHIEILLQTHDPCITDRVTVLVSSIVNLRNMVVPYQISDPPGDGA
jgi:hypothetical protein